MIDIYEKMNGFPKVEHLCSKTRINAILRSGHCLKYQSIKLLYLDNSSLDYNRLLVSVPKKIFKRAVIRNLIKRRIREAYRLQKSNLSAVGVDLFFIYISKDILSFDDIYKLIGEAISDVNSLQNERLA